MTSIEHLSDRELAALFGLDERQPWQDLALCAQYDPNVFFPEPGGSVREAKAICAMCQVRSECLALALRRQERFGILGGLTERERRRLARTQRGTAA